MMCGREFKPYQVGTFYNVPCVYGRLNRDIAWWPVMGEAHRDSEIIGFDPLHYHVDWRFVSARLYRRNVEGTARGASIEAHAVPLMLMPDSGYYIRRIEDGFSELKHQSKRLKCKRQLPTYPYSRAKWIDPLSQHHAGSCLKRNVCPHRGYDLSREPVVDGEVTCPLHGLRWNVETGACIQPHTASTSLATTVAAGA